MGGGGGGLMTKGTQKRRKGSGQWGHTWRSSFGGGGWVWGQHE